MKELEEAELPSGCRKGRRMGMHMLKMGKKKELVTLEEQSAG